MTDSPAERLDEVGVVALLRLPLPVAGLSALVTGLEKVYGPGLAMHQHPDGYLIVQRPVVAPG